MTQHQQDLDRILSVEAEDRRSNLEGSLTLAQVKRARRHFAFLAFFIAVFFGGALAVLLFDPVSRWSLMGVFLLGAAALSGWLLLRYICMMHRLRPGFAVQVVEGVLTRHGSSKGSRTRHLTLRIGDLIFGADVSLWHIVRDGGRYKAYFIEPAKQIPFYLVALEEVVNEE